MRVPAVLQGRLLTVVSVELGRPRSPATASARPALPEGGAGRSSDRAGCGKNLLRRSSQLPDTELTEIEASTASNREK